MAGGAVRVQGLRELRKAFRESGSRKFDRHLTKANQRIAGRIVETARPGLAAVSSTVAAAMSPQKTARGARVRIDRAAAPMAAGVIFGAYQDQPRVGPSGRRFRGYNQFRQWGDPYHVYPEIEQLNPDIEDEFAAAVTEYLDAEGVPRS